MGVKINKHEHGPDGPESGLDPVQPLADPSNFSFTLSKSDLIDIIREAKRPSPDVEAREDKERKRLEDRRQRRLRIAKAETQARINRQKMCRHRKPNGEETVGGQPFSDGRVRMFCLRCQVVLREYWAPEVAQGMAIAKKAATLGITDKDIMEAADFRGEGELKFDEPDDFALAFPRGTMQPDLTTEHH
jgi:hypothetical protein